jgi:DNA primase large subunit
MASDDRRQGVADISDEVLEFVKPNIFERKMLKTKTRKESVTEELYYVRNELSGQRYCGGQKAVTAIPAI